MTVGQRLPFLLKSGIIKVFRLKKGIHSGVLHSSTWIGHFVYEYMDELAEANHLSMKGRNNLQEGDYLVVSYYGEGLC